MHKCKNVAHAKSDVCVCVMLLHQFGIIYLYANDYKVFQVI